MISDKINKSIPCRKEEVTRRVQFPSNVVSVIISENHRNKQKQIKKNDINILCIPSSRQKCKYIIVLSTNERIEKDVKIGQGLGVTI